MTSGPFNAEQGALLYPPTLLNNKHLHGVQKVPRFALFAALSVLLVSISRVPLRLLGLGHRAREQSVTRERKPAAVRSSAGRTNKNMLCWQNIYHVTPIHVDCIVAASLKVGLSLVAHPLLFLESVYIASSASALDCCSEPEVRMF